MTRGFVTIATGEDKFYRIAANLLHSYRLFASDPMPFALICDRINDHCKDFDQVIVLDKPFRSYLDKLHLPENIPFDETIFIDGDCLAYRDLNDFWGAFENGSDFSAFGKDYHARYKFAWFRLEDTGEYAEQIRTIPDFIGGVYFIRKTPDMTAFSETCTHILDNYYTYTFRQFTDPADEPVFALAMSVHGYTTAGERSLPVCFYPHIMKFEADILQGTMCYDDIYRKEEGMFHDAYLIHWGSGNTGRPVYRLEEYKLNQLMKGKKPGKTAVTLAERRIHVTYRIRRFVKAVRKRIGFS